VVVVVEVDVLARRSRTGGRFVHDPFQVHGDVHVYRFITSSIFAARQGFNGCVPPLR
jgi:hypothetical protein